MVSSAKRAQGLHDRPIYVLGSGFAHWHRQISCMEDLTVTPAVESGRKAFAQAGLRPADIDVFFPYDGYSIDAVAIVEAAGFCGIGEATDYFRSSWDPARQQLLFNGRTPVTTNGGGLSHGRSGGSNLYAEAVRQLRGNEGDRQVPGARTALVGIGSFFHDPAAMTFCR